MVREIVHDPMFLGQKSVDATEDEFFYGREEKVKKIRQGSNPGITELVLREI